MFYSLILLALTFPTVEPPPAALSIRVTESIVAPPAPAPDASLPLAADEVLVVDADVDVMVWSFPDGLLTVTKESGPLKLRAKFAGGSGKLETRTFKGKSIAIVEAKGTGAATLLIVPVGATSEQAGIIKRIAANQGAKPPPDEVKPQPPIPTAKAVYIAVVRDPRQVSPDQAALLTDVAFWNAFKAAQHEWDVYAPTSPDAVTKGYVRVAERVQVAGQPYTATMVILDKATGDLLAVVPLPRDKAGVVEELKKVVSK